MYGTAWKKEATTQLVQQAVAAGFTAIDTANQLIHYQEAWWARRCSSWRSKARRVTASFCKPSLHRPTAKTIAPPMMRHADLTTQVKQSFDSSLTHLHTDYVDSYVLHGPYYRRGLGAEDWEVWAAIEAAV